MKHHIDVRIPKTCCACGACLNICPTKAIKMDADELGFFYPKVNINKCINCGKCIQVCKFRVDNFGHRDNIITYAAVNTKETILDRSSSGGIFTAIAESIIKEGGVVFGAVWTNCFSVCHRCITRIEDIYQVNGSKYVQSDTGRTYEEAKILLEKGQLVCYSGTPCQISGLKAYLAKDYNNLLTVDIICHGVPNNKFLKEDIAYLSKKYGLSTVKNVCFRDKRYGWGTMGSISDATKIIKYNSLNSPYYFFFLKGELYRESCYSCRYPAEGRQGDITLGDYWRIGKDSLIKLKNPNEKSGISCVLVNSQRGIYWIEKIGTTILKTKTALEDVKRKNAQLMHCSKPSNKHEEIMQGYLRYGYSFVVRSYEKEWKSRLILRVKSMVPRKIKRIIVNWL